MACDSKTRIGAGTVAKFGVTIEPIGSASAEDMDFVIRCYVHPGTYEEVPKKEMIAEADGSFTFFVNTSRLGEGDLKARVIIYVPDGQAPDNVRKEEAVFDMGAYIYR